MANSLLGLDGASHVRLRKLISKAFTPRATSRLQETIHDVVNGLIERHGGLPGIIAQLEQQGLGNTVRSWIGTGPNQPISPDQVHQAFGPDLVKQLAIDKHSVSRRRFIRLHE